MTFFFLDLAGKIPIGPVVVLPDMQTHSLHIDTLLIHLREPKFNVVDIKFVFERLCIENRFKIANIVPFRYQRPDIVDITVAVNIHCQHAFAVHHYLAAFTPTCLRRRIANAA
jgi:hypothetical protein